MALRPSLVTLWPEIMKIPDKEGVWLHVPTNQEIDIYPLEPCLGVLCLWGPDVGITYSGSRETQGVWTTDEWQGHIPVGFWDDEGPWEFLRDF